MVFNTGAALLDAVVLAAVSKEEDGTYGYKITQDVRRAIEISESTLYPVLRRLQKDKCLEVYDRECGGRNRRYYKITENGNARLQESRIEWETYSANISSIFSGEESLLMDIPVDEREEALAYYRSYFEDAGEENEDKIIMELESPEKVASIIKSDCVTDVVGAEGKSKQEHHSKSNSGNESGLKQARSSFDNFYQNNKGLTIFLIIVAALLASPVWLPVGGSLFGVIMGAAGLLFGLIVGSWGLAIGLIISGLVCVGMGIGVLFANLPTGLVMIGIGLLLLVFGILFLLVALLLCVKLIPWIFRSISELFHRNSEAKRKGARV